MKVTTLQQQCSSCARELFTAFVLSVLFLVTGCASYTERAELAPAPPFMASLQAYGPPLPAEIAMLQTINSITPAAGDDADTVPARHCFAGTEFKDSENPIDFGFDSAASHGSGYGFSDLHAGGQMTVRFTFALPLPSRKNFSCR